MKRDGRGGTVVSLVKKKESHTLKKAPMLAIVERRVISESDCPLDDNKLPHRFPA